MLNFMKMTSMGTVGSNRGIKVFFWRTKIEIPWWPNFYFSGHRKHHQKSWETWCRSWTRGDDAGWYFWLYSFWCKLKCYNLNFCQFGSIFNIRWRQQCLKNLQLIINLGYQGWHYSDRHYNTEFFSYNIILQFRWLGQTVKLFNIIH